MSTKHYRVFLSGRLLPGFSHEQALAALAEVFDAPVEELRGVLDGSEHPVGGLLGADQALDLQGKLEKAGIACRIEREREQKKTPLQLRATGWQSTPVDPAHAPRMMNCPACGHRQPVSNRCRACGIVFVEYQRQQRQAHDRLADAAGASVAAPGRGPRMEDYMHDFVDDKEPDETYYLSLFFGPDAAPYLRACRRYGETSRSGFALGWNWATVLSPFLWTLYRKMWLWSLLLFVTEVFLPVLLITLGHYDNRLHRLMYLGYAGIIGNRIFWPALLNALYCRHARGMLRRLNMLSPNYAAEINVASAGGVSRSSLLVGIALYMVTLLFIWSLVDSIYESSQQAVQQRVALDAAQGSSGTTTAPPGSGSANANQSDPTGLIGGGMMSQDAANHPQTAKTGSTANRWVETRRKLRVLGQRVSVWLAQHPGAGVSGLSLYRLQEDLKLPDGELLDAWGSRVQLVPDNEGYRLLSAGPDGLFGTPDDIQYRRALSN